MTLQDPTAVSTGEVSHASYLDTAGIEIELRNHLAGDILIPPRQSIAELVIDTVGNQVLVSAAGPDCETNQIFQKGSMWLIPSLTGERRITLAASMTGLLHIRLSQAIFGLNNMGLEAKRLTFAQLPFGFFKPDNFVTSVAELLRSELLAPSAVAQMTIQSMGCSVASWLARSFLNLGAGIEGETRSKGLERKRLVRVLDHVDDHIQTALTINELADVACLSPYHFARGFKTAMGLPPHEYVRKKRMDKAKALLLTTGLPLAEVGRAIGFADHANFCRAFRNSVGVPPGEYRNQHGLNNPAIIYQAERQMNISGRHAPSLRQNALQVA